MATTFISYPSENYPVLTSQLQSIRARTDQPKVMVKVVRDPDGAIDEFFSTTLYAFNGIVELSGLGKLIEERFRAQNRIFDTMSVVIEDASVDFMVVYCEYNLESFDIQNSFWSAADSSIVHRDSAISLSHWSNGSNTYHVKVVGINPDGVITSVERDFTRQNSASTVSFSVYELLLFALNQSEVGTGDAISKVAYFSIAYGNIQKMFYVVDDPFYLTFCFKNIFNAPEYVDVVGTVKRKTVTDRDTAVCSGTSRQYNRVVKRTYEMTTGPLTESQALELEQLIASHSVSLCSANYDLDIIITDHTSEVSNDDDTLISMKFTFRFVDERPWLLESDLTALCPANSRIFSEQFTAEFA